MAYADTGIAQRRPHALREGRPGQAAGGLETAVAAERTGQLEALVEQQESTHGDDGPVLRRGRGAVQTFEVGGDSGVLLDRIDRHGNSHNWIRVEPADATGIVRR